MPLVTRIATSIGALDGQDVTYISTPCIKIDGHYLMQGHHLKYNDEGDLVFFFRGYTNEIQLPNSDLHLYKSLELTFTLVEQEKARRSSASRRTRNKAGSSISHLQHQHHWCLKRTMRDGSKLCRHLGSRLGISLAMDTPRIHMRLEGRLGTRPEDQDGMRDTLTPPTPRGYHHPSIHDSPLRTVGSWMASTVASEDWKSAQVKFKIHLILICMIQDNGTYSSNKSSWTSMRC